MKADSLKLPYNGCPPGLRHSFLHLLGVLSQLGPSLRTALSRWSCGAQSSNRPGGQSVANGWSIWWSKSLHALPSKSPPNFRALEGFLEASVAPASPYALPQPTLPPSLPYRRGSGDASASLLHVNLHFRDYSWGTQMTTGPLLPTRSFPVAL